MAFLQLSFLLLFIPTVFANTEKVIFKSDDAAVSAENTLCLPSLNPETRSSIRALLNASSAATQDWFFLEGLQRGSRYEVKACWVATQPTDIELDVFTIPEVLASKEQTQSLARSLQVKPGCRQISDLNQDNEPGLLLRVASEATFYSARESLMLEPPLVGVDIIIDPYLLNVLPVTLLPTVAVVVVTAIVAYLLSGRVWSMLSQIAEDCGRKPHID